MEKLKKELKEIEYEKNRMELQKMHAQMRQQKVEQLESLEGLMQEMAGNRNLSQAQIDRIRKKAMSIQKKSVVKKPREVIKNLKPIEELFKEKRLSILDIEKLHYKQFNKPDSRGN